MRGSPQEIQDQGLSLSELQAVLASEYQNELSDQDVDRVHGNAMFTRRLGGTDFCILTNDNQLVRVRVQNFQGRKAFHIVTLPYSAEEENPDFTDLDVQSIHHPGQCSKEYIDAVQVRTRNREVFKTNNTLVARLRNTAGKLFGGSRT